MSKAANRRELLDQIDDLIKQATVERSHFYVGAVLRRCREALVQGEGWRDIASAPMDGTWVDLWCVPRNGCAPGRSTDAHWTHGAWRTASCMSDSSPGPEIDMDATHFMPLPAPPATQDTPPVEKP